MKGVLAVMVDFRAWREDRLSLKAFHEVEWMSNEVGRYRLLFWIANIAATEFTTSVSLGF